MSYKLKIQIECYDAERMMNAGLYVEAVHVPTGKVRRDLRILARNCKLEILASAEYEFYTFRYVDRSEIERLLAGVI